MSDRTFFFLEKKEELPSQTYFLKALALANIFVLFSVLLRTQLSLDVDEAAVVVVYLGTH